jgi:hypothetical protein
MTNPEFEESSAERHTQFNPRVKQALAQIDMMEARIPKESPFQEEWVQKMRDNMPDAMARAVEEGDVNATVVTFADAGINYPPNEEAAAGMLTAFGAGYHDKEGKFTGVNLENLGTLADPKNDALPRLTREAAEQTTEGSYVVTDTGEADGNVNEVILQTSIDGLPIDGIRLRLDGNHISSPSPVAPQVRPLLFIRTS